MSEDMEELVKLEDPIMDDIKIKHSYKKYIVCLSILSLILVCFIIVYCFVLPEEEQGVNGMNKNERVEKKLKKMIMLVEMIKLMKMINGKNPIEKQMNLYQNLVELKELIFYLELKI